MGMLGYIDEWAVVNAVYETLTADAKATKKARKVESTGTENGKTRGTTPVADAVPVADREVDIVGSGRQPPPSAR